jgi:hypothetical protein
MLRIERLDKQSSAASAEEPQDQGSVFADEKQFDFWNQADDADDADAGIQTKPDLAAEVLEL